MKIEESQLELLRAKAVEIRRSCITAGYESGPERKIHIGPALSYADIAVALYYQCIKVDPSNPQWLDRDRVIVSKGHGILSVYAILADLGFFSGSYLSKIRHIGSILQGHPDMKKTPGIDMTAGSLGNGLGAGVGMAISAKKDQRDSQVYVVIGDGELNEGIIWESAACASKYKLDNLVAIIDNNSLQSSGSCDDILPCESIGSRFGAFGFDVVEIDGHDMAEIVSTVEAVKQDKNERPKAIIAHTIKGKGVSFMEGDNSWHQRSITKEEHDSALKMLGA